MGHGGHGWLASWRRRRRPHYRNVCAFSLPFPCLMVLVLAPSRNERPPSLVRRRGFFLALSCFSTLVYDGNTAPPCHNPWSGLQWTKFRSKREVLGPRLYGNRWGHTRAWMAGMGGGSRLGISGFLIQPQVRNVARVDLSSSKFCRLPSAVCVRV